MKTVFTLLFLVLLGTACYASDGEVRAKVLGLELDEAAAETAEESTRELSSRGVIVPGTRPAPPPPRRRNPPIVVVQPVRPRRRRRRRGPVAAPTPSGKGMMGGSKSGSGGGGRPNRRRRRGRRPVRPVRPIRPVVPVPPVRPPVRPVPPAVPFNGYVCPGTVLYCIQLFPELDTLESLIFQAGLTRFLEGNDFVTVLAPDNRAFQSLPANVYNSLTSNVRLLRETLRGHILEGYYESRDFFRGQLLHTFEGTTVQVTEASSFVGFNYNVYITIYDIYADNGIIHIIDGVFVAYH